MSLDSVGPSPQHRWMDRHPWLVTLLVLGAFACAALAAFEVAAGDVFGALGLAGAAYLLWLPARQTVMDARF